MKRFFVFCVLATSSIAFAFDIQCVVGTNKCISTQGTKIPSEKVLEMMDRCESFTQGNIGMRVLRMSQKEIIDSPGRTASPIRMAWFAFEDLYNSPLEFDRNTNSEELKFSQIKQSCKRLNADFNEWAK